LVAAVLTAHSLFRFVSRPTEVKFAADDAPLPSLSEQQQQQQQHQQQQQQQQQREMIFFNVVFAVTARPDSHGTAWGSRDDSAADRKAAHRKRMEQYKVYHTYVYKDTS
jgi:hypothetical protein